MKFKVKPAILLPVVIVMVTLGVTMTTAAPPASQQQSAAENMMAAPPEDVGASTRLLGGEFCSRAYQVALLIQTKKDKKSFCGGSLIAPGWVLTAAHCAEEAKSMKMHFGSQLRSLYHKQANNTEIHMHPKWDSNELKYDCALIRYPISDVTIDGSNITTIRLPSEAQQNKTFVGEKSTVSGWGRESDFAIKPGDKLKCLNGTIIQNELCSAPYVGVIGKEHICMQGRPQSSTCHGDSGGPLVVSEPDGQLTQVGIVSFGPAFGCGWGWPPVFARVTACQAWINETIKASEDPAAPAEIPAPAPPADGSMSQSDVPRPGGGCMSQI